MSKTKRYVPHFCLRANYELFRAWRLPRDGYDYVGRDRRGNGYDKHWPTSRCGSAGSRNPRGYNTWDEVGSGGRKLAKRGAARVIRSRGKEMIRKELEDD